MDKKMEKQGGDPIFGEVISRYTQAQALEDGVLVLTGYVGKEKVVFTRNLFSPRYEDPLERRSLVERGLELLRKPDPEDSPGMRLRAIEPGRVWVIWNPGEGFTFLAPDDY